MPPAPTARGPRRLTFVAVPDECNLACAMCREHSPLAPRPPAPPRRLPLTAVLAVLEEVAARGLAEVIPSTTGEPLLWRDLPALAARCAALGVRLNVTTNGTFPRRGGAGWAEVLAGASSDVKVSWGGATAATAEAVLGGLRYPEALAGLRAFLAVRDARRAAGLPACTVSFQVAARERNVAELGDVVRLAAALGVERVKVNQLQVHFPALAGEDLRRSPASRARWNAAVGAMRAAAEEARLPGGAPVRLLGAVPLDEGGALPAPGPCPFLGEEGWVLVDGAFAPCPAPAAKEGRLGDFGNVRDAGLLPIWEGAAYRALVEGYRDRPPCRGCPFRRTGGL